jgi:hypothetical protein
MVGLLASLGDALLGQRLTQSGMLVVHGSDKEPDSRETAQTTRSRSDPTGTALDRQTFDLAGVRACAYGPTS